MQSRRPPTHHKPWAVSLMMVLVLAAGIGIGVGSGYAILAARSERQASKDWEQAEMQVDRPARRAEILSLPEAAPHKAQDPEEEPFEPLAPLPEPRPAGVAANPAPAEIRVPPLPPAQMAALPQAAPIPEPAPDSSGKPAWVRYAVPSPQVAGKPMIAVVIDDLGVDRRRSEKVVGLPGPLTLAWMTYADNLQGITKTAHGRGHELMVHMPMQPMSESYDPGPDVLEVGLKPDELRRRIRWGLSRFDGFVGVNNHMGSRFTADKAGMSVVMEEIKARGLLFLDSVTTQKSVVPELARQYDVPFAARHVFLDNDMAVSAVREQLAKTESYARKHGAAIAIGHPHDGTIEALSTWLPTLAAKGFVLVPVTTIVRQGR